MRAQAKAAAGRRHVRASPGRHARRRWTWVWLSQLAFFGLPWLGWNGRVLVRFDLAGQSGQLFGMALLPRDFICAHCYRIAVAGAGLRAWPASVRLDGGAGRVLAVRVASPRGAGGSRPIAFSLQARDDAAIALSAPAVFVAGPAARERIAGDAGEWEPF